MKSSLLLLNFVKYMIFSICILYSIKKDNDIQYYLQTSFLISLSMIIAEYLLDSISRDVRENFSTTDEMVDKKLNQQLDDLIKQRGEMDKMVEQNLLETEILKEEQEQEQEQEESRYSYVHPDALKLPEIRIPRCIQDTKCNVCPVMLGDAYMSVPRVKKPIAGCE
jgi:hypothetical protein